MPVRLILDVGRNPAAVYEYVSCRSIERPDDQERARGEGSRVRRGGRSCAVFLGYVVVHACSVLLCGTIIRMAIAAVASSVELYSCCTVLHETCACPNMHVGCVEVYRMEDATH